ncbi:hypothetical protein GOBAR_DD10508 [Gossypium barbadense]|nr:hypothetical protein GOBAR_DD10508 [Gossypium barbadense]
MAKEQEENGNGSSSLLVELPLREAAEGFELEKAICSHGLFMLAPNHWDPISRSFSRPLRLTSPPLTVTVRISQPPTSSSSTLYLRVYGASSLSPPHRHSLLNQVSRMLRLSESEENKVREFRSIVEALHGEEEATEYLRSFSGRVFRSPTLFEDMVKCIILCNYAFIFDTDLESEQVQVHSKSCTVQTVGRDVELIYAKYAPFQFLAYWAEMWHFYGQRFGKLSELPVSDYKFITASNMKNKKIATRKRSKTSAEE